MFRVGDLVKVKEDARSLKDLGYAEGMYKYRGGVYEVYGTNVDENPRWYYLNNCENNYANWIFDESWLELVEPEKQYTIEEKEIEKLFI